MRTCPVSFLHLFFAVSLSPSLYVIGFLFLGLSAQDQASYNALATRLLTYFCSVAREEEGTAWNGSFLSLSFSGGVNALSLSTSWRVRTLTSLYRLGIRLLREREKEKKRFGSGGK